ncbi:MAG: hypothetical protein EOM50_04320 [Erysipelotrichia bacterium]|nr:hypothetical protein [Erysipelotrichia bacterium]NCC54462.1 hypothetical protein [Erysipelotrichia bacterium]
MKKIRQVIYEFLSLEGSLFRYSLSYCFLLALLPGIIVALLMFQYSIVGVDNLLVLLYRFVPEDLISPFIEFIMDKSYHSILGVGLALIVPCFVASKSFYSFMLISAKEEFFDGYKVLIRLHSFILFFVFVGEIVILAMLVHFLRWPVLPAFGIGLFIVFWLFFRMLSFEKRPISFGIIGSLFVSVALLLVAYVFIYFIQMFTSYQTMYGPLASLVVLFLAVYVISCIIYFGYCLNIVYGTHRNKKEYKSEWYYTTGEKVICFIRKKLLRGK